MLATLESWRWTCLLQTLQELLQVCAVIDLIVGRHISVSEDNGGTCLELHSVYLQCLCSFQVALTKMPWYSCVTQNRSDS